MTSKSSSSLFANDATQTTDQASASSTSLTLRWYQQYAVDATYEHIRTRDDNPCVVIPTAGGKSAVIATFIRDVVGMWGRRVMVLSHVKELLEQTEAELRRVDPTLPVGIYSAGLKRRDMDHSAIIAGVQSVYTKAFDFYPFDLIVVDEAHLIPADGEGMYRRFLAEAKLVNPAVRLVGLTATPYRLKSGSICEPDNLLNHICFEVGVRELIQQGYLSKLVSRCSRKRIETEGVKIEGGEYVAKQLEAKAAGILPAAVAEAVEECKRRKSVLVFAAGVDNGKQIADLLESHGETVAEIYGDTFDGVREQAINDFKEGRIKWLVNVNVLTTGFNATNIDAVVCFRPTMSLGLWYQMVGRGFRLHPGKENCLVLDFGGNLNRHGPIDLLEPVKRTGRIGTAPHQTCPECRTQIYASYDRCPECGFLIREAKEKQQIESTPAVGTIVSNELQTYAVQAVEYSVHMRKGWKEGEPRSMRVSYQIGWNNFIHEWVCFEHFGYARDRAHEWWRLRSPDPVPENTEHAVDAAKNGAVCQTKTITVNHHDKSGFDRIVKYSLGILPPPMEPCEAIETSDLFEDAELPF